MRRNHRGFTLVELLVVIAIIGTLVALLLPAVQSARESARGNTCRNNIKQLQLAMTSYDSQKNRLPGYINELIDPNGPKVQNHPTIGRRASWIVMAFPYMEQTPLWDQWNNFDTTDPPVPGIEGLVCPSHPPETPSNPWLAFVGNAGQAFSDTTRGSDDHEYAGNGVFSDDNQNPNFGSKDGRGDMNNAIDYPRIQMSINYIQSADGTSKTMMISENTHAWYWAYDPSNANNIADTKHIFGFVWKNPTSNQPLPYERINGDKYYDKNTEPASMSDFAATPSPGSPKYESYGFPTSNHPGIVNVAFCDGHLVSMNENIDPLVYAQLMTTNRNKSKLADQRQGAPGIADRKLQQPSDDQY